MKEVKNNISSEFLLDLLNQGKTTTQICKELSISKQLLSYYMRSLKAKNLIKKVGYGTWEVNKEVKIITSNTLSKQVKIRGHAFMWHIKLSKQFNWKIYNLKQLRNKVFQIIINNKKIWLGNKTIVIYENKDFYGLNSIESRKSATVELINTLKALEMTLDIKLGKYGLKIVKEHYAQIKNELAHEYNQRKEKMLIKDGLDGWLWIDFSDGVDELETNNIVISKQVQDWWNDNKSHNFKVTPTFLMESINKVTNNQVMFAKNMESHILAIQKLGNAVDRLENTIKKKKTYSKSFQTTLKEY